MYYQVMKKRAAEVLLSIITMLRSKCAENAIFEKVRLFKVKCEGNPYFRLMRLDNLTGFWLLVLPVLWSVCFATLKLSSSIYYALIAALGALMMRSAGCIINDIFDRNYDKNVERTANRPLASGEANLKTAIMVLSGLLVASLALLLSLPNTSIQAAFLVFAGVCLYPLAKRYTDYAQVFLGFTFNLGVLVMWFAIDSRPNFVPFALYFSAVVWTVAYDTIYAYQDVKDDINLGLKSLAVKLGDKAQDFLLNLYGMMLLLLTIIGVTRFMPPIYYFILGGIAYFFYPKIRHLDLKQRERCATIFRMNKYFGFSILMAIITGMICR